MSDGELQALVALLEDQTARVNNEVARATAQKEEPHIWNFYTDHLREQVWEELKRRQVI